MPWSCQVSPLPCVLCPFIRKQWKIRQNGQNGISSEHHFNKTCSLFYFLTRIYKNLNLRNLSFGKMLAGLFQKNILYQYLLIQSFLSAVGVNEQLFPISVPTHRSLLKVLLRRPLAADHTQAIVDFSLEPQCEKIQKSVISIIIIKLKSKILKWKGNPSDVVFSST